MSREHENGYEQGKAQGAGKIENSRQRGRRRAVIVESRNGRWHVREWVEQGSNTRAVGGALGPSFDEARSSAPFEPTNSLAAAMAWSAREFPDHWLIWSATPEVAPADGNATAARSDENAETLSQGLSDELVHALLERPRNRHELWHSTLVPSVWDAVRSLGYVDLDDCSLCERSASAEPSGPKQDWLIGEELGIVHCSVLAQVGWECRSKLDAVNWIDFGRRASRAGAVCWGDVSLRRTTLEHQSEVRPSDLRPMIEACYGHRWVTFWSFVRAIYGPQRVGALATFLKGVALGAGKRQREVLDGSAVREDVEDSRIVPAELPTVSVIVPTFGRETSLRNLLLDLESQDHQPLQVVVVEQKTGGFAPYQSSTFLGLSYSVTHKTVPWVGAGRARNLALGLARGELALLLDDDVALPKDFLSKLLLEFVVFDADSLSAQVVSPPASDLADFASGGRTWADHRSLVAVIGSSRKKQCGSGGVRMQSDFAGGASLVSMQALRFVDGFDQRLDLGYGEDFDLGVRLRRAGFNVLASDHQWLGHLHAPTGGFRALEDLDWDGEPEPKPSPHILLSRRSLSREMQRSYVLVYLLRVWKELFPFPSPIAFGRKLMGLRASFRWAKKIALRERGGIGAGSRDSRDGVADR